MIDWHEQHNITLTFGQKAADKIASFGGSWNFIGIFAFVLVTWMAYNVWTFYHITPDAFDPYPFILLNLVLSCLAAIQAPIIMMSQNRQADRDRHQSQADYVTNLESLTILRQIAKYHEIEVSFRDPQDV